MRKNKRSRKKIIEDYCDENDKFEKIKKKRHSKTSKQWDKIRIKQERLPLHIIADNLRKNLPPSEKWFWDMYIDANSLDEHDKCNEVYGPFIPDILNLKYKYIIEIDGSVHDDKKVQAKDKRRDKYFEDQGFTVIRVKAYSRGSFNACLQDLFHIRRRLTSEPSS